ncbi:hypothetical protein J6590_068735 [Homalodisca vitripennis]|nr:hypothetical protein J6590_068735 [Homalodisca vitripennis]
MPLKYNCPKTFRHVRSGRNIAPYASAWLRHARIEMGVLNQSLSFNQSVVQLFKSLVSEDRNDIPTDTVTKDVVALSAGGYLIARIYTDNPGFWFFHCHFAYHLDAGMSGVLQVGEVDTFPEPPAGFPRCGSFLPPL